MGRYNEESTIWGRFGVDGWVTYTCKMISVEMLCCWRLATDMSVLNHLKLAAVVKICLLLAE